MPAAETLVKFLQALGAHDPIVGDKWVSCQCPLAPFTHKKGFDSRPSFGVNIESGMFNCFTCQKGSLADLVGALEHYSSKPGFEGWAARYHFQTAREILEGIEDALVALPEYGATTAQRVFEEWPEYWLHIHTPWREAPRAAWYLLTGRCKAGKADSVPNQPIDPSVADALDLRYDSANDRIVSPYRNIFGKLAGARGRALEPTAKMQHWDFQWNKVNNASLVWYNEPVLDKAIEDRRPVVVVEGQFDCANVLRAYPYVLANLTAKPSEDKLKKLQHAPAVILMLDNDDAGRQATEEFKKKLRVPVGVMSYPYKDPAKLPLEVMQYLFKDV